MEAKVLIVDDEKHTREGLQLSLQDRFDVYIAADGEQALEVLRSEAIDVMVTDLRLGQEDGMALIERALTLPRPPICIMMTAYGSVDTAVEAMKRGAYDFVTKPLNIDKLEILIARALRSQEVEAENRALRQRVTPSKGLKKLLGKSPAMQEIYETIQTVAPSKATVLIQGESGTGKELAAQAIHSLSGRQKIITVHCAALSEQLLESELFGHERGAFTGAVQKRIGRFEEAHGGTLLLDEIGEISSGTQVKLLRALGERTIERVGGNAPIPVDVRLIAATNRDLKQMVARGEFREDLYYRLHVVEMTMPPLRARREDIFLLAEAFLQEFARENGKDIEGFTSDALQMLYDYDWPGNVRELRTAVEHGVVMSSGPKITVRHLPSAIRQASKGGVSSPIQAVATDSKGELNLHLMEEKMIARALEETRGNRTEAAKKLGISRRTLLRKLQAASGAEGEK